MYDAADKNSKFLEAINRAALKNCETLDAEVKQQTKAEMEKAEAKIHAECHRKMEKEIRKIKSATEGELAKYSAGKRELLSARRQEIEDAVFRAVKEKLAAYRESQAYQDGLLHSARQMKPLFDGQDDVEVLVAQADLALADELKQIFGNCQVKADRGNTLGGLRVQSLSGKTVANDTFAVRLEQQRQWFAEQSGLKIV